MGPEGIEIEIGEEGPDSEEVQGGEKIDSIHSFGVKSLKSREAGEVDC